MNDLSSLHESIHTSPDGVAPHEVKRLCRILVLGKLRGVVARQIRQTPWDAEEFAINLGQTPDILKSLFLRGLKQSGL